MPERKRQEAVEAEQEQTETGARAGAESGLLELQHGAGNRAVSQMISNEHGDQSPFDQGALISRIGHAAPGSAPTGTGKIQRKDGPDDETSSDTTEDTVEDMPDTTLSTPSEPGQQASYAGTVGGNVSQLSGDVAGLAVTAGLIASIPLPTGSTSGSDPAMSIAVDLTTAGASLFSTASALRLEVDLALQGLGSTVPGPQLVPLLRRAHATFGVVVLAAEKAMNVMAIATSPARSILSLFVNATRMLGDDLVELFVTLSEVQAALAVQASGSGPGPSGPSEEDSIVAEALGHLSSDALAAQALLQGLPW